MCLAKTLKMVIEQSASGAHVPLLRSITDSTCWRVRTSGSSSEPLVPSSK